MSVRPRKDQAVSEGRKKVTIQSLQTQRQNNIPITMLTAYDYPTGRACSSNPNLDITLVGDSLAQVCLGLESTTELTLQDMIHHARAVSRGTTHPLLVADMPFGTYHVSTASATANAIRLVQEARVEAVKLEGGSEVLEVVRQLTRIGIPVMAHVGLMPQRHIAMSGYRVQGRNAEAARRVLNDALALEEAGAFAIVVEAVPEKLGTYITQRLKIPTIGIGAGPGTSGQVLVWDDAMGTWGGHKAKFVRRFADLQTPRDCGVAEYTMAVREGQFPGEAESYSIDTEEWENLLMNPTKTRHRRRWHVADLVRLPSSRSILAYNPGACGKTSLLCAFALGEFPKEYQPTVFDNYVAEIRLDEKPVQLALWDTAYVSLYVITLNSSYVPPQQSGQEEYERLRPMSYSKSHVILIAFALDTPDSLENVTTKWIEEVRSICGPSIPVILVGCKADLRPATITPDTPWVTREQGERVAQAIGARAYKECSALKIEGVDDVFETATRASMLMRDGVPANGNSQHSEVKHHRRRSSGRGTLQEDEHQKYLEEKEIYVDLPPPEQVKLIITDRAAERLRTIAATQESPDIALRITVESGGCHGYQYKMELAADHSPDDYHFAHPTLQPSNVLVDAVSLSLINGSTIDFATELIGSSFRVEDNPQAKGSGCGCGVSWELKE
ncbi:hypothetical protein H0H93_016164 [Arthromyces matolae]|nr:hypothetical protein H0H93_016164 [Arthromyces matolae]